MGGYCFFCKMTQVSGALHFTVMQEQECGEVTVNDMNGLKGGDLDEAEWWVGLLNNNPEMQVVLENIQIKAVTEVNLPLLK